MYIKEINKGGGYIICASEQQRIDIAKLLHENHISHITSSGQKTFDGFMLQERQKRHDGLLIIGLYKADFFSLLEKANRNFPIYFASSILNKPTNFCSRPENICNDAICLHECNKLGYHRSNSFYPAIPIPMSTTIPIRKEIHSRAQFAARQCEKWYPKIGHANSSGGNLYSCLPAQKYSQARRIYVHYTNEYQKAQLLKLSK